MATSGVRLQTFGSCDIEPTINILPIPTTGTVPFQRTAPTQMSSMPGMTRGKHASNGSSTFLAPHTGITTTLISSRNAVLLLLGLMLAVSGCEGSGKALAPDALDDAAVDGSSGAGLCEQSCRRTAAQGCRSPEPECVELCEETLGGPCTELVRAATRCAVEASDIMCMGDDVVIPSCRSAFDAASACLLMPRDAGAEAPSS